ncbi:AIPR family protein [uncultured Aquimarina sp.]|uniref:AIPR family protein n=1 Tax=uncultured Aquimarina sp. TaxID=575652 RepID=UPI002632A7A7|nr:AIPR family protein [uncultured Aquimarina sp.]
MSILHLNRIKRLLENQVQEHIDISEIKKEKNNISEEEMENIVLSQSFMLFTLRNLTGESYIDLRSFITDGFQDNGIDAVYYSTTKNELYICQSKWIKKGTGGVDKGDILKFLKGIIDLLHLNFTDFNEKLKKHSSTIENAILTANIKIKIVIAYSGNSLSKENKKLITDKIDEFNDTEEIIFFQEYNIKNAYTNLKDSVDGEPINADIDLADWGHTNEPYKSFYGTINCGQIAELLESSNRRIYSKNIRSFIGLTGINNEIVDTLIKEPENFFYLNNGIVLLCKEIRKSPYNSGKRELGKFHLTDLTVVNGAQTVGAINYSFKKQPEKVNAAKVFVKIISLENTPKNFDKNITIASNTQNKIEKRDFVSLDNQQKRLINEFFLSGLKYHTKRDDKKLIKNYENYYFEEATISLACSKDDIDFSTYAKREIGKLWEDQSYNQLFNDGLNIQILINLVNIFRETDILVKQLQASERLICSHGLYLLTHLIYSNIGKDKILNPKFDSRKYLKDEFKKDFKTYSVRLVQIYQAEFPNNKFPLSIFKNFRYCRSLKDSILFREGKPRIGQTLNLFDELG